MHRNVQESEPCKTGRDLAAPRTKTDTEAKAFIVNDPNLWNSLPCSH